MNMRLHTKVFCMDFYSFYRILLGRIFCITEIVNVLFILFTDEVMTGIYFRYLRCCWMGVVILSSL